MVILYKRGRTGSSKWGPGQITLGKRKSLLMACKGDAIQELGEDVNTSPDIPTLTDATTRSRRKVYMLERHLQHGFALNSFLTKCSSVCFLYFFFFVFPILFYRINKTWPGHDGPHPSPIREGHISAHDQKQSKTETSDTALKSCRGKSKRLCTSIVRHLIHHRPCLRL